MDQSRKSIEAGQDAKGIDPEVLPKIETDLEKRISRTFGNIEAYRTLIESGFFGSVKIKDELKKLLLSQLDILEKSLKGE